MSAYTTNGRPSQIISLGHGTADTQSDQGGSEIPNFPNVPNMFAKLDAFVHAAKQLEVLLAQEKNKARKLKEELDNAHATYDRLLQEAHGQSREISIREERLKAALAAYQGYEKKITVQGKAMAQEVRKLKAELSHYKAAWAGVLQREKEAKIFIEESSRLRLRGNELESRCKLAEEALESQKAKNAQIERHSQSYQAELQSTLIRLHSAESKFKQLSIELSAYQQSRKTIDEEIAKIEASMQERLHWASLKEREKIRAELEKESALERERFRNTQIQSRSQADMELGRLTSALEVERHDTLKLRQENDHLHNELKKKTGLAESGSAAVAESSKDLVRVEEELRAAQSAIDRLSVELDAERALASRCGTFEEAFNIEVKCSQSLERALVEEKERFDALAAQLYTEVEKLRRKCDQLLNVPSEQKADFEVEFTLQKEKIESATMINTWVAEDGDQFL